VLSHRSSAAQVSEVQAGAVRVGLVRVRNPWGGGRGRGADHAEWTGEYSDGHASWDAVAEEDKQRLGIVDEEDGEFWMSIGDFRKHWAELDICHPSPDSMVVWCAVDCAPARPRQSRSPAWPGVRPPGAGSGGARQRPGQGVAPGVGKAGVFLCMALTDEIKDDISMNCVSMNLCTLSP
jgi:hypothetical protein